MSCNQTTYKEKSKFRHANKDLQNTEGKSIDSCLVTKVRRKKRVNLDVHIRQDL